MDTDYRGRMNAKFGYDSGHGRTHDLTIVRQRSCAEDISQHSGVDVSARHHAHHLAPSIAATGERRRDRCRARAFGDDARPLDEQTYGRRDLVQRSYQCAVDEAL